MNDDTRDANILIVTPGAVYDMPMSIFKSMRFTPIYIGSSIVIHLWSGAKIKVVGDREWHGENISAGDYERMTYTATYLPPHSTIREGTGSTPHEAVENLLNYQRL